MINGFNKHAFLYIHYLNYKQNYFNLYIYIEGSIRLVEFRYWLEMAQIYEIIRFLGRKIQIGTLYYVKTYSSLIYLHSLFQIRYE